MSVTIGVDPHKASHTAAALDQAGQLLDQRQFPATDAGYQALRRWAESWPQRCWAVEGAGGMGRPLAQRLVADREHVLDVPAKLAARVRVLSTGHGRKTDPVDAVSVAAVATAPARSSRCPSPSPSAHQIDQPLRPSHSRSGSRALGSNAPLVMRA